ncbi:hypothetical protein HYH03_014747 [Edaphochlamys debaryana]|uniref:TIR domain-containing protein n=1 Tax=Edaphochlamys debaryana TaxID=47281 RepID=A0A835XNF7_9CHLO|nr:hypothetical protein HYH03_014747 [Edaphochlamys debaryana]|eukprot:KAG2486577.1 hypothetical protein HYH03_014747 [Edaphochlamys debaryana]
MAEHGGGGRKSVHLKSGDRNVMLLDNGPLVVAPPPTPVKPPTAPPPPPGGAAGDGKAAGGGGKAGGGDGKGGKGLADPLAEGAGGAAAAADGRRRRGPTTHEPGAGGMNDPLAHEGAEGGRDGGFGRGGEGGDPLGDAGGDRDLEPGKIYISHKWSVNTQEWIQRWIGMFDRAGLSYMQSDMGSDAYIDALEYHIARCEYCVLLVTREFAVSVHGHQSRQHKEVKWAMKHRCRIVPILHKDLVGSSPFYDPPGSHVAKSGSALSDAEKSHLAHACRPLQQFVEKDLHDVFFTKVLSRLGRKSKSYDITQVKELLELAGLTRAFELLTLGKQYGGAGVQTVSDLKKLFADDRHAAEPNTSTSAGLWSYKLQLSAAEESRLRSTMGGWHALSCMPHWMRHGELSVACALAGALDDQIIARFGVLDMSSLGSAGLMGEGGGMTVARFVGEYAGLWQRDAPRSNSPGPGASPGGAGAGNAPQQPPGVFLTHLSIEGCSVGSRGAVVLLDALAVGKVALQHFDLAKNGLDHQAVPTLVKFLRTCNTLESLRLSENPIGDLSGTSLMQCLGRYPGRLAQLDLARVNVGQQSIKALAQAVTNCRTLKRLVLAGNGLSGRVLGGLCGALFAGGVEMLDISDNPVGLDFAVALSAAATAAVTAAVAEAAAAALAAAEAAPPASAAATPQTTSSGAAPPAAAAGSSAPTPSPPVVPRLAFSRQISFAGSSLAASAASEVVPVAPGPSLLILADTNLGPDGMQALCGALRQCGGLHGLSLPRNALSYDGLAALAGLMAGFGGQQLSTLTTLDLGGNFLPSDGVASLASALRRLPGLKVLSLEGCGLSGPEVAVVCEAVRVSDRVLDLLGKVMLGVINPHSSVQQGTIPGISGPNEVMLGLQDSMLDLLAARGGRFSLVNIDAYGGVEAVCGLPQGTTMKVLPDTPSMLLRWMLQHGHLRSLLLHGLEALSLAREGDRRGLARFQQQLQEMRGAGCKLRALNVGQNCLPPEAGTGIAVMLCFNSSLQDLQLRGSSCDRSTFKAFEQWHKVIKGFQEALPCAPALTALDATAAGITDACSAGFRRLLECSASLRHLRLDRNRLNQPAMQILAPALTTQPALLSLSMDACCDEAPAMAAAVHVLGGNLRLQRVSLRGCFLDGAIGKGLAAAVAKHPNLTALSLGGAMRYKIGDDGATALGRALRSSLRLASVNLAVVGLADGAGTSALAAALASNNRLKEVDLSGNSIGPHGGQQLVSALQQRSIRLQRLALDGNVRVPPHTLRAAMNMCTPAVADRKGVQDFSGGSISAGPPPHDWGPFNPIGDALPGGPGGGGGGGGGGGSGPGGTPAGSTVPVLMLRSKSSTGLQALLSPRFLSTSSPRGPNLTSGGGGEGGPRPPVSGHASLRSRNGVTLGSAAATTEPGGGSAPASPRGGGAAARRPGSAPRGRSNLGGTGGGGGGSPARRRGGAAGSGGGAGGGGGDMEDPLADDDDLMSNAGGPGTSRRASPRRGGGGMGVMEDPLADDGGGAVLMRSQSGLSPARTPRRRGASTSAVPGSLQPQSSTPLSINLSGVLSGALSGALPDPTAPPPGSPNMSERGSGGGRLTPRSRVPVSREPSQQWAERLGAGGGPPLKMSPRDSAPASSPDSHSPMYSPRGTAAFTRSATTGFVGTAGGGTGTGADGGGMFPTPPTARHMSLRQLAVEGSAAAAAAAGSPTAMLSPRGGGSGSGVGPGGAPESPGSGGARPRSAATGASPARLPPGSPRESSGSRQRLLS